MNIYIILLLFRRLLHFSLIKDSNKVQIQHSLQALKQILVEDKLIQVILMLQPMTLIKNHLLDNNSNREVWVTTKLHLIKSHSRKSLCNVLSHDFVRKEIFLRTAMSVLQINWCSRVTIWKLLYTLYRNNTQEQEVLLVFCAKFTHTHLAKLFMYTCIKSDYHFRQYNNILFSWQLW